MLSFGIAVSERELDGAGRANNALDGPVGAGVGGKAHAKVLCHHETCDAAGDRPHHDVTGDRVHDLDATTHADQTRVIERRAPVLVSDLAGACALHNGVADETIEDATEHAGDRIGAERHRGDQRALDHLTGITATRKVRA